MENYIGKKLNQRYQVISLLGEGGMGAVLKGFDPVLQRDVAIKVMHPHFSRQPNMRERFLQEARVAGRLNHASIVKVYDFGQQESLLFIVMEFIEGDNLRSILDDMKSAGKQITLRESVLAAAQVSAALHYAHRHGVLHRDIKPANIMIVPEPTGGLPYRPVLTDLGLAKLLEGQPITQDGVSMGTPAYMSPEQALGQKIDARSDVYSMGILLYELCVGHPPFPAHSISDAIRYHTKEPPPSPRSIRADIPDVVERLILKALAKEAEARFQDADALAHALMGLPLDSLHAGTASILTAYQASLVERGKSILQDFEPVVQRGMDVVQILGENQATNHFEIGKATITIGRGQNNDIVIEDSRLSRQHARLEFDGNDYFITDLESTNGTYLANTRLLPGVRELWAPEKAVRMGSTWLKLQRAAEKSQEPTTDRYIRQIEPDNVSMPARSITGKRVTAALATDRLRVNTGEMITIPVQLLNHGQLVDHYRLAITGVAAEWVTVSEQGIQLMPQERGELVFSIHPPRRPDSRAGNYPLRIQILSEVAAGEYIEIEAQLQVAPYYQFDFLLRPQRQRGVTEAVYTTVLRNVCNTGLTFDLAGEDPEDRCRFVFEPPFVTTTPGGEASGKLILRTKGTGRVEVPRSHNFCLTARSRENSDLTKQAFGEWEKTPLLLDVQVTPAVVRSSGPAKYNVRLHNRSEQDLPVQLECKDDEDCCQFHLDPKSLVIPAGAEQNIRLAVTNDQGLRSGQEKTFRFNVKAGLVNVPDQFQRAEAQWVRTIPRIDGLISEIQPRSIEQGLFQVTVKNVGEDAVRVSLAGVDAGKCCVFEFEPQEVTLDAANEQVVHVVVRPRDPVYEKPGKKHNIQVVLQAMGFSGIEKRLEAVYEQLPEVRKGSLFLCWLLICLGWAIAIPVGGGFFTQVIYFDSSGPTEVLIAGLIAGLLTGGIGGLLTGLGLKAAHPAVKFRHILAAMLVWSALWAIYYGPLVMMLD